MADAAEAPGHAADIATDRLKEEPHVELFTLHRLAQRYSVRHKVTGETHILPEGGEWKLCYAGEFAYAWCPQLLAIWLSALMSKSLWSVDGRLVLSDSAKDEDEPGALQWVDDVSNNYTVRPGSIVLEWAYD